MPWLTAGAMIGGALLSSNATSDAADKQSQAAKDAANQTKFMPYNVHSGYGDVNYTLPTQPTSGGGGGGFMSNMLNGSGSAGSPGSITTSLSAPYQQLRDQYQNMANSAYGDTNKYGSDFTGGLYNNMLSMNQPYEQQQQNSLENRLAAQGMLGSTGGSWQQQGLQNSFNTNHQQMQNQAYTLGNDLQNSAYNRYNQAVQGAAGVDNLPMEAAKLGASVGQMQSYGNQFGANLQYQTSANQAANEAQFWNTIGGSLQPGGMLSNSLNSAFGNNNSNAQWGGGGANPYSGYTFDPSYASNGYNPNMSSLAGMNTNQYFTPGTASGN